MTPSYTLHIISNTHWDREWYLSFEHFRLRLVQLMDRLLDLLERQSPQFGGQPAYRFVLDGQFIPVKDYLEIRPERAADVQRFVQAGRLKIGPWYTQPLETLASGESMLRNLLLGMRKSQEFGGCMEIAYMIDQFGHASQLPQILAGFGIQRAVVWRGVPRDYPAVFRWAASDGSEVLLYYSNGGYGEATALPLEWEDHFEVIDHMPFGRQGLKNRVEGLVEHRQHKATTPHLLCLNGIDHSFAQEDILEVIAAVNSAFPDLHMRQSTLEEYCAAVEAAHADQRLPYARHQGELMDSNEPVLIDIHSARVDQKMWNRRAEGILERQAEPLAALAWLSGSEYPGALLGQAWEYVLQNHSHDSLGCSSVDEVYRQVLARYEWACDLGGEIAAQSLQALAFRSAAAQTLGEEELLLCVFNPLQQARSEVVDMALDIPLALGWEAFALLGPQGEVPCQATARRDTVTTRFNPLRGHASQIPITRWTISFAAESIPGLGWQLYRVTPRRGVAAPPAPTAQSSAPPALENEHLRVSVHADGSFDLLDKASRRTFAGLHVFEDCGEAGNGYQHEKPLRDQLVTSAGLPAEIQRVEDTPLRSAIEVRLTLALPAGLNSERTARLEERLPCPITTRLSLARGARRLEIETTVDNTARDHRLRVRFPTGIAGRPSYAEMPFDVVTRPPGTPSGGPEQWEQPRPTHPMHAFAGVEGDPLAGGDPPAGGKRGGLMIANRGLYEYELADDPDHSLILTLLRCTDRIDAHPYGEMEETRIPAAQCPGKTIFHYSLIPYSGSWLHARAEAHAFCHPLKAALVRLPEQGVLPGFDPNPLQLALPDRHSFLEIEPPELTLTALKQSERGSGLAPELRGLVVRLLNLSDDPVQGRVRLSLPGLQFSQAWLASLNEEHLRQLPLDGDGWVSADVGPKGLFTVVLYR